MISPIDIASITPLHVRSGYSLLAGTAMPGRLIERAVELGYSQLAMTDVNGLYGVPMFYQQAVAAGVRPILGAELTADVEMQQEHGRDAQATHGRDAHATHGQDAQATHGRDAQATHSPYGQATRCVVVLIESERGYENLCQLITRRHRGGAALVSDVAELHEGLNFIVEAESLAGPLAGVVPAGRLWLGVDAATQTYSRRGQLIECSRRLGLPLVATGKALFTEASDYDLARLLAAIRLGKTYETVTAGDLPHPRAYLRSGRELQAQMAEFPRALENNRLLAGRCGEYAFGPRKPVFPDFPCPGGLGAAAYLRQVCQEGLRRRYGPMPSDAAHSRLDKELRLIERMGFCEYFLVVWDIVQYARRQKAPVAGRGSGASSLAAYVLGITNVCPLKYEIPFERFLHEGREDFPDLDVDFCWRVRDDVIQYAFRRWGSDHVAMVSTHNTFQPKSALRETAKAMGYSNDQLSRLDELGSDGGKTSWSGRLGYGSQQTAEMPGQDGLGTHGRDAHATRGQDARDTLSQGRDALETHGRDAHATRGQDARDTLNQGRGALETHGRDAHATKDAIRGFAEVVQFSKRLLGLPHNLSVHPGGIVIGRKPIDHYVPVQQAAKGVTICQYDKNGVEDVRLVKLDLLGNRNLSTIRWAGDLIRERHGLELDVESLPPDDPATITLLQSADTVGCNQLESPAMRHLLRMMQPTGAGDVMKVLALIRPGAASIGMKEAFIRRRRGLEAVPAGQDQVDAMLRGTYGIMLYEDDVMLVASAMLGGNLAEADRFRKAVQKCPDDEHRLNLSRDFLGRCVANGIGLDYAKGIWVQMAKFNAYSFCRAHAASYAVLAYAGAYLRTHFPLEFWTAALNNNQSLYSPRVYVEQAQRDRIVFLLPDVNRSGREFGIEGEAIRVGLNFVGGLGPAGVGAILEERQARGPFAGVSDFLLRTLVAAQPCRSLVLCGAFDWTGRTRPTLMMELNLFGKIGRSNLTDPWRRGGALLPAVPHIPNIATDYTPRRKYFDEREVLGISVGEHVLAMYRRDHPELGTMADATSRDIPNRLGREIRIAGVVEAFRTTGTDRGGVMGFMTLDDEGGLFEVTVFPDVFRRLEGRLGPYGPYLVTGKVEDQYGAITITAHDIKLLNEVSRTNRQEVTNAF